MAAEAAAVGFIPHIVGVGLDLKVFFAAKLILPVWAPSVGSGFKVPDSYVCRESPSYTAGLRPGPLTSPSSQCSWAVAGRSS